MNLRYCFFSVCFLSFRFGFTLISRFISQTVLGFTIESNCNVSISVYNYEFILIFFSVLDERVSR